MYQRNEKVFGLRHPHDRWINHEYQDTYRIAGYVQEILANYVDYLRDLEGLTIDQGILDFIPNWQRDTALHKFVRYVTDLLYQQENDGSVKVPVYLQEGRRRWTVPVEALLVKYQISEKIEFLIPEVPQVEIRNGNIVSYEDAPEVADACWEYMAEARLTGEYEKLLEKIADEVFYILFTNRTLLQNLHYYLSRAVATEVDPELLKDEYPHLVKHVLKSGRLKRASIPSWACRAIFYRDRGICTSCKTDVSGLMHSFGEENFDHIIPLARGGLNDITNLQLLCRNCNMKKSDRLQQVGRDYLRWF